MTRKYDFSELGDIFWSKVKKSDDDSCWEWLGGKDSEGYGAFWFDRRMCGTHRVAWILFYGEIPDNLCVCHTCDNRKCCNPKHLWLGTHTDNMQDKSKKGKCPDVSGENNPRRKLSKDDVYNIFKLNDSGILTRDIASLYGVTMGTIRKIVTGGSWVSYYREVYGSNS